MARLTWDTFPKTGSAWLAHTLEAAFPHDQIVWGGHRAATLRYEHNVITTLRHPAPTVAAYMVFFHHEDPDRLLDWYCRFTTATITYASRVMVAAFEDITQTPGQVMAAYADLFRLTPSEPVTVEDVYARTVSSHPAHLPSNQGVARQRAAEAVAAASLLPDAVRLYNLARPQCVPLVQDHRLVTNQ